MNPYILHGIMILLSVVGIIELKPEKPTDNQSAVLCCLGLFAYSINFTLVALFSSTHDIEWLSVAWLPFFGAFGLSMWGLWKS